MTPEQLDRLEQLAREATPGQARRMAAGFPLERALSPAVVLELVDAARLGAAWDEVLAAMPEGWEGALDMTGGGRAAAIDKKAPLGPDRAVWASGPTPSAALLALAEALRKRP